MDCSSCYYPNEDDARFCIRCAAALGVSLQQLPVQPPPVPADLDKAKLLDGAGGVSSSFLGERYRVLRCLGSGGFGSVYEAEEVDTGLRVAVKLLHHSALLDPRMRERFLQEARMIAELRSPHVVRLYDFSVTEGGTESASPATGGMVPAKPSGGGLPYLVMELIEGKNLAALLMRGVLAPRRSLHIMAQVCAALGEAHALGIVHRDIKPDNILLLTSKTAGEDFVKVVDFGVARLRGPATRPSDVLGTPAFISPETLANEPVDGRSDLYSVGMLLWQMMLGDLPFPATNQAVMMNSHLAAPRRTPSEVLPGLRGRLPAGLESLMVRLIARRPADRPASAYEVRAALLSFMPRVPEEPFSDMALPNFGPCWDGPLDPLPPPSHAATARQASPDPAVADPAASPSLAPGRGARPGKSPARDDRNLGDAPPARLPLHKRLRRLFHGSSASANASANSNDRPPLR
ncbi:MAG TPA: serine/threonine-protein kinase [Pseudomonadota bacterium]|nr:serine/threonine-protein kinase [Pseudomonadota bacterium]